MPRKIYAFSTSLLVFALLVSACSKSAGSSPTAAARAFYDAAKSKDVKGMKNALSKKSLELMESFAKLENKTLDDSLKENSKLPATFEARNEKITGDTATVELKGQGDKWDTIPFVKEDGQWKIAFDKAMENSMKDAGPAPGPDLPPPGAGKGEGEQSTPDDEHPAQ
jgi:hypothetical protein